MYTGNSLSYGDMIYIFVNRDLDYNFGYKLLVIIWVYDKKINKIIYNV